MEIYRGLFFRLQKTQIGKLFMTDIKNGKYDFSESEWNMSKNELRSILIDTAKKKKIITYKEVAFRIASVKLAPNSGGLGALLSEITNEEYLQGKGLLGAVVVKSGPYPFPGDGFFKCAKKCGKITLGRQKFWFFELNKVFSIHQVKNDR